MVVDQRNRGGQKRRLHGEVRGTALTDTVMDISLRRSMILFLLL